MIPIEDAATVAYVGVIHAISEVYEALSYKPAGLMINQALQDALEDLVNVRDTLKPHVRKADPPKSETMQEYMIRMGW